MKTKRIFFTGFMGAGKSTIGQILANTLGWNFYDLDAEIVKFSGKPVVDIFKDEGESKFRELETTVLSELVKDEGIIVALGGGAVLFAGVANLIKSSGATVYLKASPERIYDRLKFKTDRPLFQTIEGGALSKEEAMKKIRTMLTEREDTYNQADLIFNTEGLSVGKIIDKLKLELERKY
jgi:shikimate kinase